MFTNSGTAACIITQGWRRTISNKSAAILEKSMFMYKSCVSKCCLAVRYLCAISKFFLGAECYYVIAYVLSASGWDLGQPPFDQSTSSFSKMQLVFIFLFGRNKRVSAPTVYINNTKRTKCHIQQGKRRESVKKKEN